MKTPSLMTLIAVPFISVCVVGPDSLPTTPVPTSPVTSVGAPARVTSAAPIAAAPTAEDDLHQPLTSAPTCESRIAEAPLVPLSARHEAYFAALPTIIVEARIVPVLYLSWPDEAVSNEASEIRRQLRERRRTRRAIREVLQAHRNDRALLREVFLSEGYLFEERPELARALVRELSLSDLFDEPGIVRYRAGEIETLRRDGTEYLDSEGRPARLLLNDRVALTAAELQRPLHLDLVQVRGQSGALRTIPRGIGEDRAAFELVFPDGTRRAGLVELGPSGAEVRCIGGDQASLAATLEDARRFWQRQHAIRDAARHIVAERPRFDEPLGEPEGVQEDGRLRRLWLEAYRSGRRVFTYRDVVYPVFDRQGNPVPPEVCVDFVFDTWERASGTWYRTRDAEPGRTSGELDFSRVDGLRRRNISAVLDFAAENPDSPIERYDLPRQAQVPLRRQDSFARALSEQVDAIRDGDALIIHGLRERDMREHFHSVVVLTTDPLTGVPMEVADNQGRPRVGTLELAMRAAPLRAIKYRLRVDYDALPHTDA